MSAQKREWYEQGKILDSGRTQTGMDFKLGTVESEEEADVLAVEIVKYIVDEYGNLIHSNKRVDNDFIIYEKLPAYNSAVNGATNTIDRSVIGVGIDNTTIPDGLYNDYHVLRHGTVAVWSGGIGQTYDYDLSANSRPLPSGMYYIEEDPEYIQETITDLEGKEWTYINTYFETESPWRGNTAHDGYRHTSPLYSASGDSAYRSIPEVVGYYQDEQGNWTWNDNGTEKPIRNGFLEFYVYNVYTSRKGNVNFYKTDVDGQALGGAVFTLFNSYENGMLSDEVRTDRIVEAVSSAETGEVVFENVPVGTYYMQETVAPPYCQKSDTVYLVVIEEDDDGDVNSRVTNLDGSPLLNNTIVNDEGSYGSLTFDKVDSGHQPLQGAVFTLYRSADCAEGMELMINDSVVAACSDASGKVAFTAEQVIMDEVISGIPTGNYYMKETTLPDGSYTSNNRRFFVHIGPGDSAEDTSFIAELDLNPSLNGLSLEEYYRNKAIEQVVNYRDNELIVRKVWRDYYGNNTMGNEPVTLKLLQWTKPDTDYTVHVDFQFTGSGGGNQSGGPTSFYTMQNTGHGDLTIRWGYNQWTVAQDHNVTVTDQNGHSYNVTRVNGNSATVSGGSGSGSVVIAGVDRELYITVLLDNSGYDGYDGGNDYSRFEMSFSGGTAAGTDYIHIPNGERTITLGTEGIWSESFTVAGDGVLDAGGSTIPASYNGKECVYTIEEVGVTSGYTVTYSTSTGIGSGTLTAYNQRNSADITVVKVDQSRKSVRLKSAVFSLRAIDGTTVGVSYIQDESSAVSKETDSYGTAVFDNLALGYYEIKETKVPEGYILQGEGTIYIKVTENGVYRIDKDLAKSPSEWREATDNERVSFSDGTAIIGNTPGEALPSTGGTGAILIYLIGILTIGIAGAGFMMSRKREVA